MFKTPGLPMWVTLFALAACLMGCASGLAGVVAGLTGNGMEGTNGPMSISWGGRSVALGLIAGVAVILKNPSAYIVALIGGLGRDVGDLIGSFSKPELPLGIVVFLAVFIALGIAGVLVANRARQQLST